MKCQKCDSKKLMGLSASDGSIVPAYICSTCGCDCIKIDHVDINHNGKRVSCQLNIARNEQ